MVKKALMLVLYTATIVAFSEIIFNRGYATEDKGKETQIGRYQFCVDQQSYLYVMDTTNGKISATYVRSGERIYQSFDGLPSSPVGVTTDDAGFTWQEKRDAKTGEVYRYPRQILKKVR